MVCPGRMAGLVLFFLGGSVPSAGKKKRRPSLSFRLKVLAGLCLALVVGSVLAAAYATQQARVQAGAEEARQYNESVTEATPEPTTDPVTFAAVGDSITEGNSPAFAEQRLGDLSWVHHAQGDGLTFAGGWARGGAETSAMVENVAPLDADVLVILAGTNDAGHGVPFDVTAENIDGIVEEVGAERVIIPSIPPNDERPDVPIEHNIQMRAYTESQGWEWVDSASGVRDGDLYADGMTADGVHPTVEAARIMGEAIRAAILND